MNTQQLIHEAAKKHSSKTTHSGEFTKVLNTELIRWAEVDFTAGATYALSTPELWREHAIEFTKWIDQKYGNTGAYRDTWFSYEGGGSKTTDELFNLYIQQTKK